MMNKKGFTLIEMAFVLIIVGLLIGIGVTTLGVIIKREKIQLSKEIVNSAVESVIGDIQSTGKLPDEIRFKSIVRQTKDAFGKEIVYIYDKGLTEYCGRKQTKLKIEICNDPACVTPVRTIQNVAFIVLSSGSNYNNQTAGSQEVSTDTTIKIYQYGVEVDNYSGDMSRVEYYDEIVKWITLSELHKIEECKPLMITSEGNLPDAVEDTPYRARIQVEGGKPPYNFGTWNGTECDTTTLWSGYGLSMDSEGNISGTVNYDTDSNTGSITDCTGKISINNVCVKDNLGDFYHLNSELTIPVYSQPVEILTDSLPPAYEGSSYNITFSVIGGGDTYSWNIDGTLPSSLTFSNGEISGTVDSDTGCSNPSPYSFTISATSCGMTGFKGYSLTVIDPDCITGGGGGGGGSCTGIQVENVGSTRYVKKGNVSIFGCVTWFSSCQSFVSFTLYSGSCFNVYTRSNCRGGSLEASYSYTDVLGVDSNNNCTVGYNNGALVDR